MSKTREDIDSKASTALASSATAGLMPILPADTTKFLGGDLNWHIIAGGGDMTKAVYDPDLNDKIAEAQLTLNYATHSNSLDHTNDAGTQIATHAAVTTGIHGVGTSLIASTAQITSAMTTHAALTTGVHGAGTSLLAKLTDITDLNLITAANTAGNVTTAKHGFVPIAPALTTQFLRGDATWAIPPAGGGSDPWIYATLATAFTTTSATAQNVTGLSFTPAANTKYDVFGMFYVKSAGTTVGPRVGLAWPTGLTNGVATIYETVSATTQILVNLNAASSGKVTAVSIASTAYWPAQMNAVINAGATPSGSIQVQLASEVAGTAVNMGIGSFIKYRSYT